MAENNGLPFPYEFKELDPEEQELVEKNFPYLPSSYVRVGPKGYILTKPYINEAANIYNMPLRPTDVFVATYQRSGNSINRWTSADMIDESLSNSFSSFPRELLPLPG